MILKIITLFLVFMVVMGAVHKFLFPNRRGVSDLLRKPRKCPDCGRFMIGTDRCGCKS